MLIEWSQKAVPYDERKQCLSYSWWFLFNISRAITYGPSQNVLDWWWHSFVTYHPINPPAFAIPFLKSIFENKRQWIIKKRLILTSENYCISRREGWFWCDWLRWRRVCRRREWRYERRVFGDERDWYWISPCDNRGELVRNIETKAFAIYGDCDRIVSTLIEKLRTATIYRQSDLKKKSTYHPNCFWVGLRRLLMVMLTCIKWLKSMMWSM